MTFLQIPQPLGRMCASQATRAMDKSKSTRLYQDKQFHITTTTSLSLKEKAQGGQRVFPRPQKTHFPAKLCSDYTEHLLGNTQVVKWQKLPRYVTTSTRLDWPQDGKYNYTPQGTGARMTQKEGTGSLPKDGIGAEKNQKANVPMTADERFDDYSTAYASKTTWELGRTMFFFYLFQFEVFTNRSQQIMNAMRRVLGKRLSEFVLKKFIYEQFVAGETTQEIGEVVRKLKAEGVGTLIAVPIEDDVGATPAARHDSSPEHEMEENLDEILNCINLCLKVSGSNPMFQLKMTALMSPNLTKALSVACSQTPDGDGYALCQASIRTFVQGMRGQTLDIPRIKEWEKFSTTELEELERVLKRFQIINEAIVTSDTVAMVDAEYTYLNPALRHLTFAMMDICNGHKPLVFYTYQAYLKKTYQHLKSDMSYAKSRGLCFGAKLVRGAYIVKERHLAQVEGYPNPVNDDFAATSDSYHRCLEQLLCEAWENEDRIRFIIASHNEDSVRYALRRMQELGLSLDSKSVLFGQLYGMADHVSFTLGKKGCNIVKSVPYGTVEDTIPYLSRRAHENRSILDNARKEKQLVKKALWGRLARRN